jgi:curved DNA-binding protein CbpA
VRNYYQMLSIEPTADASTIKTAFRREIARYHPDKVVHLGPEFQEMAATRAAELTVAYKTLSDDALRAEYDAKLAEGVPAAPHVIVPSPPAAAPSAQPAPPAEEIPAYKTPVPTSGRSRFESERAGRDVIIRRAVAARVQSVLEALYGRI